MALTLEQLVNGIKEEPVSDAAVSVGDSFLASGVLVHPSIRPLNHEEGSPSKNKSSAWPGYLEIICCSVLVHQMN